MVRKLIYGLGNQDRRYRYTRHNSGHLFIDWLKDNWEIPVDSIVLKSEEFMNRSGEGLRRIIDSYQIHNLSHLLVVHDDLDLDLGDYRLQFGRGAAGHKGVESINNSLGTQEYWRLRIGIGRPPEGIDPNNYVLDRFSSQEWDVLQDRFQSLKDVIVSNFIK